VHENRASWLGGGYWVGTCASSDVAFGADHTGPHRCTDADRRVATGIHTEPNCHRSRPAKNLTMLLVLFTPGYGSTNTPPIVEHQPHAIFAGGSFHVPSLHATYLHDTVIQPVREHAAGGHQQ
jgi:hypothetical protein